MAASFRFVGYPAAVLVDDDNKPVIQRLWGSYLQLTGKKEAGFLQVKMVKTYFGLTRTILSLTDCLRSYL